eukprot:scaffold10200_cov122-Isochrysis_galbana.AAC.2
MARGGARGGRGRVSCCTGADPDRMVLGFRPHSSRPLDARPGPIAAMSYELCSYSAIKQHSSCLLSAVALSRSGAPALRGGPSSGRDAGDYCRGSLLLPMWGMCQYT